MEEDWQIDLEHWLEPYVRDLGNQTAAPDVSGLYRRLDRAGDRKSIQPMAARVARSAMTGVTIL